MSEQSRSGIPLKDFYKAGDRPDNKPDEVPALTRLPAAACGHFMPGMDGFIGNCQEKVMHDAPMLN